MKKIAFCLVLLGLSTMTFVGCGDGAKKKTDTKPAAGAADTKADTGAAAATDDTTEAPAAPSTDPPADPAE